MSLKKIISSANLGAERAAIDAADRHYYLWGGTVPKGGLAEDGEIPSHYFSEDRLGCVLTHADEGRGFKAKHKNIVDSDATLILRPAAMGRTLPEIIKIIIKSCRKVEKPYGLFDPYKECKVPSAVRWVCETEIEGYDYVKKIETLNVVGPAESKHPGIYNQSLIFMSEVITYVGLFNREGIRIWSLRKRK